MADRRLSEKPGCDVRLMIDQTVPRFMRAYSSRLQQDQDDGRSTMEFSQSARMPT
jgi:hypothetical protein